MTALALGPAPATLGSSPREPAPRRLPASTQSWTLTADVVVVGAGAAGLTAAREAAAAGRRVLLLVKTGLGSGATAVAQGGLAAVLGPGDTVGQHAADTVTAGAGLCDPTAVEALAGAAAGEVRRLQDLGARFDADPDGGGALALTREGGHRRDRVVHAGGDASGAEVDRVLQAALGRGVQVLEGVALLDVLLDDEGCAVGVLAGRRRADGTLEAGVVRAPATVLATGGYGQAWATTTSPAAMTGDGLAAALRAGAVVRDVEFVQFHPTVFWSGAGARGQQLLLTEALRGEGAVLVDASGRRVMSGRHPLGDLAPRDVVAAAVTERLRDHPGGLGTHVYLDATGLGARLLERRFPTVLAACRGRGVDPAVDPVPVAPGAHYTMGGVAADLDGRTSVDGLFAVGEVASTGLHGANRLASNSLTEALVAGRRCGALLARSLPRGGAPRRSEPGDGVAPDGRDTLADATSRHAGVLRTGEGLARLLGAVAAMPAYGGAEAPLTVEVLEATSLHTVSALVATAAAVRTESRGAHRRTDHPHEEPAWRRRVHLRLHDGRLLAEAGPEVSR